MSEVLAVSFDDVVARCVVQVRTAERIGTGFFVSRSTVLTSAQIVAGGEDATVVWDVVELPGRVVDRRSEIAVIELSQQVDHPSVWLAEPTDRPTTGAVVMAYGFRQHMEPALPARRLTVGQEAPAGMIGNPVVDPQTRRVTGIVVESPTGDWLVPVAELALHLSDLLDANRHDCVTWRDTVDPGLGYLLELSAKDTPPVVELEGERTPFHYLDPRRRIVSFLPRPELGKLEGWCQPESSWIIRLVWGPGGAGKTRLSVELVDRVRRLPGWTALRVLSRADAEPRELAKAVDGRRVLLCLEDAEEWAYDLPDFLKLVKDKTGLRILLLARTTGAWWGRLCGLGHIVNHDPMLLEPLGGEITPKTILEQAYRDFRAQIAPTAQEETPSVLTDAVPETAHALELVSAALAVVLHCRDNGRPPEGTIDFKHSLVDVLAHERSWWETWIKSKDQAEERAGRETFNERDFSSRVLLLPALYLATDEKQATRALKEVLAGIGFGGNLPGKVAATLATVYPPTREVPRYWNPLRPDRLGETLVLEALRDTVDQAAAAELISKVFEAGVDEAQAERALTVLARAERVADSEGQRQRVRGCIEQLLSSDGRVFLPAAITVAVALSEPGPLIDLIREASSTADEQTLRTTAVRVPDDNVILAPLEAHLWAQRARLLHEQSKNLTVSQRLAVAEQYQWQAYAHARAEETAAGLAAAQQSINHYQFVVSRGKSDQRPTLAEVSELAADLAKRCGNYDTALDHSSYATSLHHYLEADDGMQRTLKFQGEVLRELGRHKVADEKLAQAREYGIKYKTQVDIWFAQSLVPDDEGRNATPEDVTQPVDDWYTGPRPSFDDPDVRLVVPVGHFAGPMYVAVDAELPEFFEVRFRDGMFSLSAEEYAVWAVSHGDPQLVGSGQLLTTRTVVEQAARRAGMEEPGPVFDSLVSAGLLVEVGMAPESVREFARNHRMVPLALGLGNSPRNPANFQIGMPNAARVSVNHDTYHMWLFTHRSPNLLDAVETIGREAKEANEDRKSEDAVLLVEDADLLLGGLLRALQVLISTSCVFIDRV